jgi:glutamate-1-semialdehyde aminotransferase
VFELTAPSAAGAYALGLRLVEQGGPGPDPSPLSVLDMTLTVEPDGTPAGPAVPHEPPAYGAAYLHYNLPRRAPAGSLQTFWLTLENRGAKVWRRAPADGHSVDLAVFLDGALHTSLPLPRAAVRPGERVTLSWGARLPAAPGQHQFTFDLVEQNVTLFGQQGVAPLVVPFETTADEPSPGRRLMDRAFERNPWFFTPSQGVCRGGDGQTYPLFARQAKGCRITDVEGRTYIDYVMGWGCALLGYAPAQVQLAVLRALGSGAVLTLTHHLEMEVAEALCQALPCAEMVLFGKNGSDVCTAAVRLARAYTGRPKVLVCGYHGWQDWFAAQNGFAGSGVPDRPAPLVLPFPFNDLDGLARLLGEHRGEVAAVMLEPAGPVEGLNGPLRDADPAFLHAAAQLARREGALLIFDEIITGFRYPGGSVQRATGIRPDLACLGKALSAGMPLSAVVGRREIFQNAMGKIYYGPTFKGEVYSFAAAQAALESYRGHDVPGHVWRYGERLRQGINRLCEQLGAPAELIGPPFRMLLAFREPDEDRLPLMRTLVQQELLKKGVLTYRGFMLPSYAHDDEALAQTLQAFEHALGMLAHAARQDDFARHLEIPPIG